MKRSEMRGKISDVLLQFMPAVSKTHRDLIADTILTEVEREGMKLTLDDEIVTWEPPQGWDEYLKDYNNPPRDFEIKPRDRMLRYHEMARRYLQGSSIEDIANFYSVTRERVLQCIAKARRKSLNNDPD